MKTVRANDLLEELTEKLQEELPQGAVLPAWGNRPGKRWVEKLTVTGQGKEERLEGSRWKGTLECVLFLPRAGEPQDGEAALEALEAAARELSAGFSGLRRGAVALDRDTGLRTIACCLDFLGGVSQGEITLGGKQCQAAGWTVAMTQEGEELRAVGEDVPFAVAGQRTRYQVTLEGVDVTGWENLASFTAVLGSETYTGCRWKELSPGENRGVFVSYRRETAEDGSGLEG